MQNVNVQKCERIWKFEAILPAAIMSYTHHATSPSQFFTDDTEAFLLVSSRNQMFRRSFASSSAIDTIITHTDDPVSNIVSIDINAADELIYWGDSSSNKIWSSALDGSNSTEVCVCFDYIECLKNTP